MKKKLTKNKNTKLIGFDLDGVIVNHARLAVRLAKKRGFSLKLNQTHPELVKKHLPSPHRQLIHYFLYYHPLVSLEAPLMPRAKTALDRLKADKIPYFLISKRRRPELAVKLLKLRGLWPSYFSNKNTCFVSRPEDKNAKAKELGVTHFIDNETGIISQMASVKNRFLFDPYNTLGRGNYIKVKSWPELLEHLLE